jgi:hypothetical protein
MQAAEDLQIILQNLCEIALQFTASEVLENSLPIGRIIISAQVGLRFPRQNLQGSRLANPVCADESKDLSRTRDRQTVELEGVCGVAVGDFSV